MQHHEVIVIGAGVAGLYQIKRLADLGIDAVVLEAGGDLGGTWQSTRYPGARFDSESYTYGYSFSRELLDEWHWKERFSGQPENLRYLHHVADKFGLRQHMQFNCRVEAAHYDEAQNLWHLRIDDGRTGDGRALTCRFLILTLGLLSIPTLPRLEGRERFKGRSFHTFHWPSEPVEMAGKRVAVIGTGATGIQVIGEIAERIRRRVKDPKVAEKLIPRDHGFGVQRVPLETRYFEAYNRPNVHLVDISETPIVSVTESGLRTSERDYDFDIIVYATGFDAITVAFDRIDRQDVSGEKLRNEGPTTLSAVLRMV